MKYLYSFFLAFTYFSSYSQQESDIVKNTYYELNSYKQPWAMHFVTQRGECKFQNYTTPITPAIHEVNYEIPEDIVITDILLTSGNIGSVAIGLNNFGRFIFSSSAGFKTRKGDQMKIYGTTFSKKYISFNGSDQYCPAAEGFTVVLLGYYSKPFYSAEEVESLRADIYQKIEAIGIEAISEVGEEELAKRITAKLESKLELVLKELNDIKSEIYK